MGYRTRQSVEATAEEAAGMAGTFDVDGALDADLLAAWIDDPSAPCSDGIIEAMAADGGLRALVRDLRLNRLSTDTEASEQLRHRLHALGRPPSVLARIGGWSIAAAAAVAVAIVGLHLGSSAAAERSWALTSDLAAVGLAGDFDDDSFVAMLFSEADPS